jgi:cellulose synthase (UDP-forming)
MMLRSMAKSPLPTFPGGELPSPERPATRRTTRAIALTALVVSFSYLVWRIAETVNWSVWWVAVPLVLLELHAAMTLALFVFVTWDTTSAPTAATALAPPGKVAVLIPTYDEALAVLLPTVAAAVALEPAHETWMLDDGDRPEVEMLVRELGARYLARPTHEHAKAGNLNHALEVIDADFVAVLDADHVTMPGFLLRTLGYFADPSVAIVQTPQDFYNVESFEHERRKSRFERKQDRHLVNEEELFDRVLQAGKNRLGGAFWCGTGAVLRVAALREVGGVAVETVTEDIHTTIRLQRRGWRSVYHNEVLARGLAAADFDQYASQRMRWGRGAMQVLRNENPLRVSGLTVRQRLSYASTLLGWFDAWRSLGYLLIPPLVLLTGAAPIRAALGTFLLAFGTTFVLQRVAQQRLSRGRAPLVLSTVFALVRMQANLRATLTLFKPDSPSFRVTHKGRVGVDRRRGQIPVLLEVILVLNLAAAAWFAATVAGVTPLHYGIAWAAYGAAIWLVVNCVFLGAAALRVRAQRFADERRAAVRFDVRLDAHLDDKVVAVKDISWTGARVVVAKEVIAAGLTNGQLCLQIGGDHLILAADVRSRRSVPEIEDEAIALEFADHQDEVRSRLALALLGAGAFQTPQGTPAELSAASESGSTCAELERTSPASSLPLPIRTSSRPLSSSAARESPRFTRRGWR